MNTIRSTWVGWGTLCVAGGGAYYFAKRSINANRAERHEAVMRAKQEAANQERAYQSRTPATSQPESAFAKAAKTGDGRDVSGHPSMEAQDMDPAPTRHEADSVRDRVVEKGKYEAEEVWRSKKGPRLSG